MMKVTIKIKKPRNPFVMVLFRKAGSHKKSNKAMRKVEKQNLKVSITGFKH